MQSPVIHIKTISELHRLFGLTKPKHPLVSVIRHADLVIDNAFVDQRFSLDMYMISLKGSQQAVLKYGRSKYDFQEGSLVFMAPNQVFASNTADFAYSAEEWIILVHTDFVHNLGLYQTIQQYPFFNYEDSEALHVSDIEKKALTDSVRKIEVEYNQHIDQHTNEIIAINVASLLKYCQRYYDRQFITRKSINKGVLVQFENFLNAYFTHQLSEKGIPTVTQCGQALHLSPYYLSDLLKAETGKGAKEHIDLYLVNKAKNLLLHSESSISEIGYELGFEYPTHFSKLFKSKTGLSPSDFRESN
jgi:YesN/AraC family two-component response regulator